MLGHINQHIVNGLELRQIIDWMLYVQNNQTYELSENEFKYKAESIGMDYLAKVVTNMCQKYLGLDNTINWCKDVEDKFVDDLLIWILENDNFGLKRKECLLSTVSRRSASTIHQMRNPIFTFRFLTDVCIYHMKKDGLKTNKLAVWLYEIRYLLSSLLVKINLAFLKESDEFC